MLLAAGTKGRDFFLRSSLPRPTLSKIWQLADVDRDGKLNAAEFAIAMNFVQHALKGTSPPLTLPSSLLTCVHHVMHPQLPVIEDKHVTKCQTAFTAFKADLVQGVLGSEEGEREKGREGGREGGREEGPMNGWTNKWRMHDEEKKDK